MPSGSYQLYVVPGTARYHGGERLMSGVDTIVMHCTAGDRADEAVSWLNRVVGNGEGKACYHYIIDKADKIIRMCPVHMTAWHAGKSAWPSPPGPFDSVNKRSIGIAFANDNGSDTNVADDALTDFQVGAALWLCVTMCRQYDISPDRILGHREVSPGRKTDPLPKILNMDKWRDKVRMNIGNADI